MIGVWLLRTDIGTWVFDNEMDAIVKHAQVKSAATVCDLRFAEYGTKVESVTSPDMIDLDDAAETMEGIAEALDAIDSRVNSAIRKADHLTQMIERATRR